MNYCTVCKINVVDFFGHIKTTSHEAGEPAFRVRLEATEKIVRGLGDASTATLSLIARILDGGEQATTEINKVLNLAWLEESDPERSDRLRVLAGIK